MSRLRDSFDGEPPIEEIELTHKSLFPADPVEVRLRPWEFSRSASELATFLE